MDSVCRIYEVGRRRPTDSDSDLDEMSSEEESQSDDSSEGNLTSSDYDTFGSEEGWDSMEEADFLDMPSDDHNEDEE